MGVDTQYLKGFDDLASKLREIPNQLRRRVVRNALAVGGRIVRDEARRNAPVLKVRNPYRATGTLRNAIRVRTSKVARSEGNVGVFVNVKPFTKERVQQLQIYKQRGRLVSRGQSVSASFDATRTEKLLDTRVGSKRAVTTAAPDTFGSLLSASGNCSSNSPPSFECTATVAGPLRTPRTANLSQSDW